jgi:putative transposase
MDANTALRGRLREMAEERRRFGSPLLYLMLRREGWQINHKRVERVYREERLSLRLKRRRSPVRQGQTRTGPWIS